MIMQRQVPARPAARQSGTRDESAGAEDPFAKVLSGQQQDKNGAAAAKRSEAAGNGAEAAANGQDGDGEGSTKAGSDDMMALLEGLMSSAAYSRDAVQENPDAVPEDGAEAAEALAQETEAELNVNGDTGNGINLDDLGEADAEAAVATEDAAPKPEVTVGAGEKAVANATGQGVNQAPTDAQAATAAAAAPAAAAAKVAVVAKSSSEGKTPAANTGSQQSGERAEATASDPRSQIRNPAAAAEPVPAGTEAEKPTRNERSNAFAEARASLAADRNEERLESKAKNVEVLESRRFLGAQPLSGNGQMLSRSLADAGGEIFQAQRSAPAQSASVPGQPQAGQMVHTLKLQLNPASLGSVTAVLKLTGEELSVDIKVHTAEAYRQLSDDNQAILKSLRAQGYGVEQINIQHVTGGPDRSTGQTLQQGQQNAFQGPGSGDAQASGREAGGQGNGGQAGRQGNQGHEQNSYASSDTQRSDGVYL